MHMWGDSVTRKQWSQLTRPKPDNPKHLPRGWGRLCGNMLLLHQPHKLLGTACLKGLSYSPKKNHRLTRGALKPSSAASRARDSQALSPRQQQAIRQLPAAPTAQAAMTAATLSIDAAVFRQAVQVTSAFLLLIMTCLMNQGLTRVSHRIAAKQKKERYERAKDLSLLPYDRTVGNLLEWALPFLGFFWMSMILTNGATVTAGWAYVVARALYPFAAIYFGGVAGEGARPPILVATVPAYIALGFMAVATIKAVL